MMEIKYGKANRVRVMDRGMVSEGNLEVMRTSGAIYLVSTPKSLLRTVGRTPSGTKLARGSTGC